MQRTMIATLLTLGLIVAQSVSEPPVGAQAASYRVRITNLTHGQSFTPILAATHAPHVSMFLEGTTASAELQAIAEFGDIAPMMALLSGISGVGDMQSTAGLLTRGVTSEIVIGDGSSSANRNLSLAAMLIPTNDAFVGIETALPMVVGDVKVVYAYAYDAGTETNDELCSSIPGPPYAECGGPGGGGTVGGGEGVVFIHRGMRGGGDFNADTRDWNNPVARVTIERIS